MSHKIPTFFPFDRQVVLDDDSIERSKDRGRSIPWVDQAAKANQQQQIDRAGELIEQAKALNDEQPYLWSVAGYRAKLRGEPTEAVTDYTRELKLHPNEGNIYPQLAGAQLAQGKRPDAEATLQRRLEAVGSDATISIQLAQMLLEDENFAEAVVVAEVAREADPTNQRLLWLLGRTRMKAGQKAAGLSTLSAALRETDDPGLGNDIAYELTDAGYATDEVEAATRKVVDQLTAETAAWTLTTPDTEMRRRSSGKGHRQRRPTLQPSRHADILFQPFSGKGRVLFFAQRQIIQAISSMLRLVFPRFTVHLALTASSPFLYAQAHNWPLDGGVQRRSRRNPGGDRAHQTRAVCKRHCAL